MPFTVHLHLFPFHTPFQQNKIGLSEGKTQIKASENRILRIPGPKIEDITGGWRKPHDTFHNYDLS